MQLGAALVYETCGKHRGLPEFVSFQFKKRTFEKPCRTRDRLDIERHFWRINRVDWRVLTEVDIPQILVRNISLLHGYLNIDDRVPPSMEGMADVSKSLTRAALEGKQSLRKVAAKSVSPCGPFLPSLVQLSLLC